MPNQPTLFVFPNGQTWEVPQYSVYTSGGGALYTPQPDPRNIYIPECTCPSCTDYYRFERLEFERAQATEEHFLPPYIPFHPTDDYVNVTPEKEPVITNPLPEPATTTIYSTSGAALAVVNAESLTGADLSGRNLTYANLSNLDLTGTNFRNCRLGNATLQGSNLHEANLEGARLNDTNLRDVNASDANFSHAALDFVDFRNGVFVGANFSYASIYSAFNTSYADFDEAEFHGVSGISHCDGCNHVEFRPTGDIQWCVDIEEYRCSGCGRECCDHCDEYFEDLYYHEDNCSSRRADNLHEYDYRPYRYIPKGNFPAEALMGVELEVGGSEVDLCSVVQNIDPSESHLYCKHDGSVDGIEVVTHPMTLNWAKNSFDFKKLLNNLSRVGHSSDNYGIHVHVSRNAFRGVNPDGTTNKKTQPQHQMTWLMFMYRNQEAIAQIARRNSDNWASWRKPGKGELKNKAARPTSGSGGRYVAINCENDRTYEVRVFRSTLNFTEFMAAMELVDASVNYTRNITTNQVLHNQAMSWSEFYTWTKNQGARYSNLLNQMVKRTELD